MCSHSNHLSDISLYFFFKIVYLRRITFTTPDFPAHSTVNPYFFSKQKEHLYTACIRSSVYSHPYLHSSMSSGLTSSCLQQREGAYPYMFGDVLGGGGYSRAPAAHQQHSAYSQPQAPGSTGEFFFIFVYVRRGNGILLIEPGFLGNVCGELGLRSTLIFHSNSVI